MNELHVPEDGIVSMAEDHRALVGFLEDLTEAAAAGESREIVLEILDNLVRQARGHFAEEEHIMHIHEYPELSFHVHEHQFLMGQVLSLRGELRDGVRVITLSTAAFLRDWLREHIEQTDDRTMRFLSGIDPNRH